MDIMTTVNGAEVVESLDMCVDLFYKIGASRGKNIIPAFEKAFNDDPDIAMRIAQWVRDVRGGAGERQLYKDILVWLATNCPIGCRALIIKTPMVGRWDDLLALVGTPLEEDAFTLIAHGILNDKDPLCCKWMPRKGNIAVKLREFMGMTPKQYRKTLAELTNVVESNMCAKEWDSIEFGKLPSVASARYQRAFTKNADKSYQKFKAQLVGGTTTVNAGGVYPYDIVKSISTGDATVANAQWQNLPNYMEGSTSRILPVVDVSGSMYAPIGGGRHDGTTCIDVATSLGLYISERNEGIFKDKFITFSENPTIETVSGTLSERHRSMASGEWGFTTNIDKVFDLILDSGIMYDIPDNEMPDNILILSDMEFNSAYRGELLMDAISEKYEIAGYAIPSLIFWNISGSGTVPVNINADGVALVSGASPAIMRSVIACKNLNALSMMKDVVCIERYDWC